MFLRKAIGDLSFISVNTDTKIQTFQLPIYYTLGKPENHNQIKNKSYNGFPLIPD